MLGPHDLVLCAGTLPAASLRERVEAAARHGFSGLSLFLADYRRAREAGHSDAELRRWLSEHGLEIAELDPLMRWVPGVELAGDATRAGAAMFAFGEEDFFAAAEALGARSINVVLYSEAPIEPERLCEAFAGLCERAARRELLVHLEFLPWTQIPDLASALDLVADAGPNGGVMLDSWHHFRSGADPEVLRAAPAERILAVQLSDAPAQAQGPPVEETLHRRLLPGAGDAELPALLQSLADIGCRAPLGVEVFSDELAALPADEAARRAAEAARRVLQAPRA